MATAEETRAAEYRRKMTARAAWEYARKFTDFPGSGTDAQRVRDAWAPVVPDEGWDPPSSGDDRDGLQVC